MYINIRGKRILQHLCKEEIDWDDPVPDELRRWRESWKEELQLLDEMEVRWCFKPEGFVEVKKVELQKDMANVRTFVSYRSTTESTAH